MNRNLMMFHIKINRNLMIIQIKINKMNYQSLLTTNYQSQQTKTNLISQNLSRNQRMRTIQMIFQ